MKMHCPPELGRHQLNGRFNNCLMMRIVSSEAWVTSVPMNERSQLRANEPG